MGEVVELVAHRHRGARVHRALDGGIPRRGELGAHIHGLRHKLVGLKARTLGERGGIHVPLVRPVKYELQRLVDAVKVGCSLHELVQAVLQVGVGVALVRHRLLYAAGKLEGVAQGVGKRLARLGHGQPVLVGAHLGVDPDVLRVVGLLGGDLLAERLEVIEEEARRDARTSHLAGRLAHKPHEQRRGRARANSAGKRAQSTARRASHEVKRRLDLARVHALRPLPARLALSRMRLVDHPEPRRRQHLDIASYLPEQQRVVGHDDVACLGALACQVQEALVGEEGAAALLALRRGAREVAALDLAPAHTQRGHIAHGRLRGKPQGGRDGVEQLGAGLGHPARGTLLLLKLLRLVEGAGRRHACHAATHELRDLAQARVVVISLERRVGEIGAQGLVQQGKFPVDKLVGKGVRLRGDSHRDAVCLSQEGRGQQVGDGLAHTGARLERGGAVLAEGTGHLERHLHLLGAGLIAGIHLSHHAVGGKGAAHLVVAGVHKPAHLVDVVGVLAQAHLHVRAALNARVHKRERLVRCHGGHLGKDGTVAPFDIRVHLRKAVHKPGRHVAGSNKKDAPQAAGGNDVVDGTVG